MSFIPQRKPTRILSTDEAAQDTAYIEPTDMGWYERLDLYQDRKGAFEHKLLAVYSAMTLPTGEGFGVLLHEGWDNDASFDHVCEFLTEVFDVSYQTDTADNIREKAVDLDDDVLFVPSPTYGWYPADE